MNNENLEFLYGVDSSTNEDVAWTDIKSMWQELRDPTSDIYSRLSEDEAKEMADSVPVDPESALRVSQRKSGFTPEVTQIAIEVLVAIGTEVLKEPAKRAIVDYLIPALKRIWRAKDVSAQLPSDGEPESPANEAGKSDDDRCS